VWNLDDSSAYQRVLTFELPSASTWADMREGHRDVDKRNEIRKRASLAAPFVIPTSSKWAFRIQVWKNGLRPFDIENVLKPIVDAFCRKQMTRDKWDGDERLRLYPDDSLDHVTMIQVAGGRTTGEPRTVVEIFCLNEPSR
jgi:hypothetical protein